MITRGKTIKVSRHTRKGYVWKKGQKPRYRVTSSHFVGLYPTKALAKKSVAKLKKNSVHKNVRLRKVRTSSKLFKNWNIK